MLQVVLPTLLRLQGHRSTRATTGTHLPGTASYGAFQNIKFKPMKLCRIRQQHFFFAVTHQRIIEGGKHPIDYVNHSQLRVVKEKL